MKISELEKKLSKENKDTFPKIRTNKVFFNEVSKLDSDSKKSADKLYGDDNLYLKLPVKSILVSKIVPTQINLTMPNLKDVFNIDEDTGAFLVKKNQKYYIVDGHHRIAMNILQGNSKIKSYILDLDS